MRAPRMAILLCGAAAMFGCNHMPMRKPRWEVNINLNITDKINPNETVTGGLTLKRVVPIK